FSSADSIRALSEMGVSARPSEDACASIPPAAAMATSGLFPLHTHAATRVTPGVPPSVWMRTQSNQEGGASVIQRLLAGCLAVTALALAAGFGFGMVPATAAPAAKTVTVNVTLYDYYFEPANWGVTAGDTISF